MPEDFPARRLYSPEYMPKMILLMRKWYDKNAINLIWNAENHRYYLKPESSHESKEKNRNSKSAAELEEDKNKKQNEKSP